MNRNERIYTEYYAKITGSAVEFSQIPPSAIEVMDATGAKAMAKALILSDKSDRSAQAYANKYGLPRRTICDILANFRRANSDIVVHL